MVYLNSHRSDNSSSPISFTSSTGSAAAASFVSKDDPTGSSLMLATLKNIFDSVYRCDSAAVVDGASKCGSVANQALYQGVEVVLKTTTCNNYDSNLKDSVKDSVASKPFFEYQCFCDDDDFVVNNDVCTTAADAKTQHVRAPSTGGESRNDFDPTTTSLFVTDEDVRNEEAVAIRRSKWSAHTKNFYTKISSPTPRTVTTLSDVTTSPISRRRPTISEELVPSIVSKNEIELENVQNRESESNVPTTAQTPPKWVRRKIIAEIREQ